MRGAAATGMAATLMLFSGSAAAGILFALAGGVTLWSLLWFLTTFFFVSETILLDHQPLWRGIVQSMSMVRSSGFGAMGLMLVVNVLMLGFRAIWGVIGQSAVGGVAAIVVNAYLATGMLLAIFVYYADMRKRWTARVAELAARGRMNRPS